MLRSFLVTALLLTPGCATLEDSSDHDAVLATVQDFFDFLETGDASLGRRITLPDGVFVTVRERDGQQVVGSFTNADSIERMSRSSVAMRETFTEEPVVLVDGDVAAVWGRYRFERDGELSHTGVDVFNLVRTDEGWKISGGAYSLVR